MGLLSIQDILIIIFVYPLPFWLNTLLQINRQPLVLLAMRRSALPFPFPLDAGSCSNLIGKGGGKVGRRNLRPCTVCGERFVEGIQMWRAGWLRNDEGRAFYDEAGWVRGYYVCWRCWDKFDDEVKEHIFLDKLRGLCRATRSTDPQPALLRILLCSPAIIGEVIHFCVEFGWRPWRILRFHYPRGFCSWIDQVRIVDLEAHEAEALASPGHMGQTLEDTEIARRYSLARKYRATHMHHKALRRSGYFDRVEFRM